MEATGIARQSTGDYTSKQKQSISPDTIDSCPKLVARDIRHFACVTLLALQFHFPMNLTHRKN